MQVTDTRCHTNIFVLTIHMQSRMDILWILRLIALTMNGQFIPLRWLLLRHQTLLVDLKSIGNELFFKTAHSHYWWSIWKYIKSHKLQCLKTNRCKIWCYGCSLMNQEGYSFPSATLSIGLNPIGSSTPPFMCSHACMENGCKFSRSHPWCLFMVLT